MSKKIGGSTNDTLARAVDSCLDLVTVSHRRVSIGIDGSPYSRIEFSIFDSGSMRIAVSLLAHTRIEVTRFDFGLSQTSPREHSPWTGLYRIEAFRTEPSTGILRDLGDSEPATRPKTLLSNQIFMGIISLPRPLHMLEVPRAMARVIDPELQEIDRELTLMSNWYLTVRDLKLRVFMIAEQLGESCPKGESRGSALDCFRINWPQRKAAMLREFLGASE
jgi:hypothetical protein